METHAQIPPIISMDHSKLSFETAERSVPHDKRTAGMDESPADIQFEPPSVIQDRKLSIATDLPWKHQAQEGETINTIKAKSYKIHTSICHNRMYSQPAVLDTGCCPCVVRRNTLHQEWLTHKRLPPRSGTQELPGHQCVSPDSWTWTFRPTTSESP